MTFTQIRLRLTRPTRCVFFGDLYPNEECYNAETASRLRILLKVRKNVASGPVTDHWEDKNYIGWVRRGQGNKICAVIISNAGSYVPVSQSFGCEKLKKMGNPLPLFSTSSGEPHMIRMFVGKVSFRGVHTQGCRCMRIACLCYRTLFHGSYLPSYDTFRVTVKPLSKTFLPQIYPE
jgi:hypothetical protein